MRSRGRRSLARHRFARALAARTLAACLVPALAACGGGGGGIGGGPQFCATCNGGGGDDSAPDLTRGDGADVPGFDNQWGLRAINADEAWENVWAGTSTAPGTGARIGVLDTGIHAAHPAFTGVDVRAEAERNPQIRFSHGTAVASVAAGSPNNLAWIEFGGAPGIAWGARLRGFAIRLGSGDGIYRPTTLATSSDDLADSYRVSEIFAANLDVLNLSFGLPGVIDAYSETELRRYLPNTIAALAQADRGDNPAVLVWAAGNAGNDRDVHGNPAPAGSPDLLAGLPVHIQELRGHHVAVVSIRKDGGIASHSNRCGSAADWCIAAPGEAVRLAFYHESEPLSGYTESSGTSFAAPYVAGTLAIMRQLFRGQLSNKQLVTRMYATANKEGRYADRTVYGQGLLDAGAATRPVGNMFALTGGRIDGPRYGLAATGLDLGAPAGDALARAFRGREVAGFDALGAPFWHDLRPFARVAGSGAFRASLRDFLEGAAPEADPERPPPPAFAPDADERRGHLGLAAGARGLSWRNGSGLGVRAFTSEGEGGGVPRTSGALLSWSTPDGGSGIRAGWLRERDGFLRSRARGGFGSLAADGLFAGGSVSGAVLGWNLAADAEVGWSRADARGGWIEGMSPVLSSAFALRAVRAVGGRDRLALTLAQPLRVEAGRAQLAVPVGRGHDGRVFHERFEANLRPTGREIAARLRLARTVGETGEVRFGAVWTHEPGHVRGAGDDLAVMAGARVRW